MDWVPSGELFLPQISVGELKNLYKKEKNSKAKIRLLCAMLRKKEYSISDIVKHTELPRMTVSDHLRRLHKNGIEALYNKKQSGRPSKLEKNQLKELENILNQSPEMNGMPFTMWTTKLVREFIEEKYQVAYKTRQIRNILHTLGFSSQKPRPIHRRASKQIQEDFKKTSGKKCSNIPKTDMRSYSWTRASSL